MRHITLILAMSCSSACGADLSSGEVDAAVDAAAASKQDPSAADPNQDLLKAPFKGGYEVHAWNEGGEIWFTLISGTNRTKTTEEILRAPPSVDPNGIVLVRGKGVAELRAALRRLPEGTHVRLWTLPEPELPPLDPQQRAKVAAVLDEFR